jgi:hypothetical protein
MPPITLHSSPSYPRTLTYGLSLFLLFPYRHHVLVPYYSKEGRRKAKGGASLTHSSSKERNLPHNPQGEKSSKNL